MEIPRGTVRSERVESRVLEGNLPGDPRLRELWIYLPPGYESGKERYPVAWCLSGFTGRGRMLLNDNPWSPGIADRMDSLIAAGRAKPMILALPDCFTHLGGSQYVNSPALGNYEDHVIEELIPLVDARYRTLAEPSHRGVIGKSSGGYGALRLGMRHPGVFGAAVCHSGDIYFEYCYKRDFAPAIRTIRKGGGLEAWLSAFRNTPRKQRHDFEALNIIAMAAAYSPNVAAPPAYCDLPFDLETGAIDEDVWKRWLGFDPLFLVERHAGDLKKLELLYLDCGTEDEFHLDFGARCFVKRLKDLGIPHEYDEFEDGHMSIQYRMDVSLPKLSHAIAR
ncbi:MAG TPA: alpha/beta hydrolase-fold protein [Candidatus Limnocylindrales bacterium]|nr:alpha/beta hydrolase-fold protein [Candidatus Limnocylindrales bacterium]